MTEEMECDICKDPNGTGPAMVICEKHMAEADKEAEDAKKIKLRIVREDMH
jgi:hypothetical protein